MSIFAGAFARQPNQGVPAGLIDELRAAVSRNPDDSNARIEFADDKFFIVKVDIGALCEFGEYLDHALTAFVAGDPILQSDVVVLPASRTKGLKVIAQDIAAGQYDALRSCRGTYCAAIYERSSHRLHLMTDKLGIRPLYCWVSPDYIVFATALRILEVVTFCKKSMNLQGVAETACFGYPLSDRTPYSNIFSLYAAELVSSDYAGFQRRRYWHWDKLQARPAFGGSPPERLYRLFMDAVEVRLNGQKVVAAFLSGGLDSRAIVSALNGVGVEVFTANFAPLGSQDQVFGQLAAERLGTRHSHLQQSMSVPGDPYSKATVGKWLSSVEYLADCSQRPRVVWSGDGGSVGLGHVYLNSGIIEATRMGDLQGASEKFLAYNRWGLQVKLFKRRVGVELAGMVNDGIIAELESLQPTDPGRIFYLFLMLNDQRRHMSNHFENLDLTRIEFEMPFYDADFVTGILQEPIDSFLRHVFYLEWLKYFPGGVLETAWQAYPNHTPCPLPQPAGLTYQWNNESSPQEDKENRYLTLDRARLLLRERDFSYKYLDYKYMRLFMFLMKWGKADRSYLMHAPSLIYRYWSQTISCDSGVSQ